MFLPNSKSALIPEQRFILCFIPSSEYQCGYLFSFYFSEKVVKKRIHEDTVDDSQPVCQHECAYTHAHTRIHTHKYCLSCTVSCILSSKRSLFSLFCFFSMCVSRACAYLCPLTYIRSENKSCVCSLSASMIGVNIRRALIEPSWQQVCRKCV